MDELQQKQLDFLEDTVKYYSEDTSRRAVKFSGGCFYRTDDGRKCAIGRHIPDELYDVSIENKSICSIIGFECISDELRELGMLFLSDVQELHDSNVYWVSGEGLSIEGGKRVDYIKRRIIEGNYLS